MASRAEDSGVTSVAGIPRTAPSRQRSRRANPSSASSETDAQLGFDRPFRIMLPFHQRNVVTLDAEKFDFPSLKRMSASP